MELETIELGDPGRELVIGIEVSKRRRITQAAEAIHGCHGITQLGARHIGLAEDVREAVRGGSEG